MTRKKRIEDVPQDLLDQLVRQYRDYPDWKLEHHMAWLEAQGFSFSRSTIHRFLVASKNQEFRARAKQTVSTKLRCLEIASHIYQGSNPEELTEVAEKLLNWLSKTKS